MADVQKDDGKIVDNNNATIIIDTSGNFGDSLSPNSPSSGLKPAERSVSFNRDVHVKRIGESYHAITPYNGTFPDAEAAWLTLNPSIFFLFIFFFTIVNQPVDN